MTTILDAVEKTLGEMTPGPWGHGDGCCGPYIDYQERPSEVSFGPEPSDYDGREPVWLGGSVLEKDRAGIVRVRNHGPALVRLARAMQRRMQLALLAETSAQPGVPVEMAACDLARAEEAAEDEMAVAMAELLKDAPTRVWP